MSESPFSRDYPEARRRFIEAADAAGAVLRAHQFVGRDDLTIDVATIGPPDRPAILVTSGLHGVEGFFGSAIQLELLRSLQRQRADDVRYVLVHALNPYGFDEVRRFNENNVDLNRNFLLDGQTYSGHPDGYAELDAFLNPQSPPSPFEPFRLKALWRIWTNGLQKLKNCVAGGQYDFPKGIFFGGSEASETMQIVRDHCEEWIGDAERIVHLDFHSGLGAFGEFVLLLTEPADSPLCDWYSSTFGATPIEPRLATDEDDGTSYSAQGVFGEWMQGRLNSRHYRFAAAEVGTYGVIRVLGAVRNENRAHHHAARESRAFERAKRELLECFCPKSPRWRSEVVERGLDLVRLGVAGLRDESSW